MANQEKNVKDNENFATNQDLKTDKYTSSEKNDLRMKSDKISDDELAIKLDAYSLEAVVELKISRFLEQIGTFYPENMYEMIMKKVELPLIKQILLRTGGNQVHAARILGINRNTLRKKMKAFGL